MLIFSQIYDRKYLYNSEINHKRSVRMKMTQQFYK